MSFRPDLGIDLLTDETGDLVLDGDFVLCDGPRCVVQDLVSRLTTEVWYRRDNSVKLPEYLRGEASQLTARSVQAATLAACSAEERLVRESIIVTAQAESNRLLVTIIASVVDGGTRLRLVLAVTDSGVTIIEDYRE